MKKDSAVGQRAGSNGMGLYKRRRLLIFHRLQEATTWGFGGLFKALEEKTRQGRGAGYLASEAEEATALAPAVAVDDCLAAIHASMRSFRVPG